MKLPSGDEIQHIALQYLVDGNEINEAEALRLCTIEVGEVRYERGSVSEVDITLRCRRGLMEKLRPVGDWEEPPELTKRLRNAIRAALPCGYGIANLDARAAIPKSNGDYRLSNPTEMNQADPPIALRAKFNSATPASNDPVTAPSGSTQSAQPEYFLTLQDAADYAGITKRTIQTWKTRGWLKAEQNGRKIRIARSDLDKCSRKQ